MQKDLKQNDLIQTDLMQKNLKYNSSKRDVDFKKHDRTYCQPQDNQGNSDMREIYLFFK